jgi:FtsZ-binding cell division protein ZapB
MMERMAGMQTEIDELKQKNTLLNDKVSDLEKSIAEVMNHQPHLAADVVEVSQVAEGVIA